MIIIVRNTNLFFDGVIIDSLLCYILVKFKKKSNIESHSIFIEVLY